MQISDVEKIITGDAAYDNFVSSFRNKETKRKAIPYLKSFLDEIPNEMFEHYLGKYPVSRSVEHLSNSFTELSLKNIKASKGIIKLFVDELKKQIDSSKISAGTAKNKIKPLKTLLKSNDVDISWHIVDHSLPFAEKSKDRAYSRKELQKMMKSAVDMTDKVIITVASSSGIRVAAWDTLCWNDLVIFYNEDNSIKGGALRVYHGDIEEYWTHLTPEACNYLLLYKEKWKSRFFNYPKNTDPLLCSVRLCKMTRLRGDGVKSRTTNFVKAIGLRPPLKEGQRRHEVMIDHGFRKYQNTMFRRAKVDFADKEDMQGRNPGGQEKSYERYVESDFERFTEYQKAIFELTIKDDERKSVELQKEKQEKNKLKLKIKENSSLQNQIDKMKITQDKIKAELFIRKNFNLT